VSLPLAEGSAAASGACTDQPRGPGKRVLIIEDNVDAANSLGEALELSEHKVAVCFSGPEGSPRPREFNPDVVLCDIGLPGMDGYEVARAFRADPALRIRICGLERLRPARGRAARRKRRIRSAHGETAPDEGPRRPHGQSPWRRLPAAAGKVRPWQHSSLKGTAQRSRNQAGRR